MATATTVAMTYQSETYICSSRRERMVAKTLIANITHSTTTPMSSGHSSSAYSSDWVLPIISVTAAAAMATLKSQSWTRASRGKTRGRRQSRITTQ